MIEQNSGIDKEGKFHSHANPLFKGTENNQVNRSNKESNGAAAGLNTGNGLSISNVSKVNLHEEDWMELGLNEGPDLLIMSEAKKRRQ